MGGKTVPQDFLQANVWLTASGLSSKIFWELSHNALGLGDCFTSHHLRSFHYLYHTAPYLQSSMHSGSTTKSSFLLQHYLSRRRVEPIYIDGVHPLHALPQCPAVQGLKDGGDQRLGCRQGVRSVLSTDTVPVRSCQGRRVP